MTARPAAANVPLRLDPDCMRDGIERSSVNRIRVATLGGLRIELDGAEVRDLPAQPVRGAVFLYLALEREATRDELATLFWGDRDIERARRSLNQTLYELRLRLGDDWVASSRDRVQVSPSVSVDALDFIAAAEAARDDEALTLYGGAFLEGFHLGGTTAFQTWVDRRRAELGRLHRDLCRRGADARTASGDLAGALVVARRWAETDPLEDEAHHHIIALLAQIGRRNEALQHYDAYRELIARELEIEPLDETKELVARIREGGSSDVQTRASTGAAAAPLVTADSRKAFDAPAERAMRGPSQPPATHSAVRFRRRWALGSALALVAVVVLVWYNARDAGNEVAESGSAALDSRALAVLPFANLSADPERTYFADGMTEDLLTHLSRIGELRVISRNSAMRYRNSQLPIPRIAAELGVRYIVAGSVRREDDQVRVAAQLIDGSNDTQLWAETYDRELSGIFEVQSDIAQRIAEQLQSRLVPVAGARIAAGATPNPAAYDLVLRGRAYLNRPGDADVRKYPPAIGFFREALAIDAGYAQAYVGLSRAYRRHVGLPIQLRQDSALFYAARAVELDPESAEAAAALGTAHLFAREPDAADAAFRRALELNPSQLEALAGRARLAATRGRFDEAVRWQQRSVDVDPFSATMLGLLGSFLLDVGETAGAETAFRRAVELSPDGPAPSFMLAQVLMIRGRETEAEQRMRMLEAVASDHPGTHFLLGRFHAQRGRFEVADTQLARAAEALGGGAADATVALQRAYVARKMGQERRAADLLGDAEADIVPKEQDGNHSPRLRLQLHALRDEPDLAVETLRQQWAEPGGELLAGPQLGFYWLDRDPLLENLRSDAAFTALLRQMRLELDSMRRLIGSPRL